MKIRKLKIRKLRWRSWIIISACLLGLLLFSLWGFSGYYNSLLTPVDSRDHQPVTVTIPSGASVKEIGHILEKKGLIRKAWAFEFYVKWNHFNDYRSGTYTFNKAMSAAQLMHDLKNGEHQGLIYLVDVRQGMWVSEIADQIARIPGFDKQDILSRLSNPAYIQNHYMNRYPFLTKAIFTKGVKYPLEGYLSPGAYRFKKGKNALTLDQVIDKMLDQTDETLKRYKAQIDANPLGSVHSILTMASLIEQEAPKSEDRRKIAGVFYNRLKKNMKLQTDPSVAYGQQRRIRDYTQKDLRTDTPYNTYTRTGLTVGPIGSPAVDAIRAVLVPERTDKLFFYARPNGKIYYTKTYAEHQALVEKYRHEWAKK